MFCSVIQKFIKDYIGGNFKPFEERLITTHLRNCPKCMEKYSRLLKIEKIKNRKNEIINIKEQISAYTDLELSEREALTLEAKMGQDKSLKEHYNEIQKLSLMLKSSMIRTKNELIFDISRDILKETKKLRANSGFLAKLRSL